MMGDRDHVTIWTNHIDAVHPAPVSDRARLHGYTLMINSELIMDLNALGAVGRAYLWLSIFNIVLEWNFPSNRASLL